MPSHPSSAHHLPGIYTLKQRHPLYIFFVRHVRVCNWGCERVAVQRSPFIIFSEPSVHFLLIGDLGAIMRARLKGQDISVADYNGRTALHIAAAAGM